MAFFLREVLYQPNKEEIIKKTLDSLIKTWFIGIKDKLAEIAKSEVNIVISDNTNSSKEFENKNKNVTSPSEKSESNNNAPVNICDSLANSDRYLINLCLDKINSNEFYNDLADAVINDLIKDKYKTIIAQLKLEENDPNSLDIARKFVKDNLDQCLKTFFLSINSKLSFIEQKIVLFIKEELFQKVLKVPPIEKLNQAERERLSVICEEEPDPDTISVAMERSFVVNDLKSKKKIGAGKLHSCVSPVVRGVNSGKNVVTHIDHGTSEESLINVMNEFDKEPLEIYFFGGIPEYKKQPVTDATELGIEHSQQCLYYLYKFAMDHKLTITVRYANVFKKTLKYRFHNMKTAQDETIGFIFNQNGQVLLFHYPELENKFLPYIRLKKAGIFEGLSYKGIIWLTMRKYMGLPPNEITPVAKADDDWNQQYVRACELSCFNKICKLIVESLSRRNFAVDLLGQDSELYEFLFEYVKQMVAQYKLEKSVDCPFTYHLMIYVTYDAYLYKNTASIYFLVTNEIEQQVREMEAKSLVHQLLHGTRIINWCYNNVRQHIVNFVNNNISSTLSSYKLYTIKSDKHLLNEFVYFKKYRYQFNLGNDTLIMDKSNLIFMLIDQINSKDVELIIDQWADIKIKSEMEMNLLPVLWKNSNIDDDIQLIINAILLDEMKKLKHSLLPFLHSESINSDSIISFINGFKTVVERRLGCCTSLDSEGLKQDIQALLQTLLKTESSSLNNQANPKDPQNPDIDPNNNIARLSINLI